MAPIKNHARKSIRVILNPAAGKGNPVLKTFNKVFLDAGYEWDIALTQGSGDGRKLAQQAIAEGVDVIVAYGGDGTLMDVASGMIGSQVPLGILPGGTGNVLSIELGIPREIQAGLHLIVNPDLHSIAPIDAGQFGDQIFFQRAGVGLEADILVNVSREAKDKYGIFAYIMGGLQVLTERHPVHYHLEIDGEQIESAGLACLIANAGNLGVPGLQLDRTVNVYDGWLDVFVIRNVDLASIFSIAATVVGGVENQGTMPHWRARQVKVVAEPRQLIQADGELLKISSPIDVQIVPKAVRVIVPKG